jgi:hypothetical protein
MLVLKILWGQAESLLKRFREAGVILITDFMKNIAWFLPVISQHLFGDLHPSQQNPVLPC